MGETQATVCHDCWQEMPFVDCERCGVGLCDCCVMDHACEDADPQPVVVVAVENPG